MSISDKLIRINKAKEDIQAALETPSEKIEEYAEIIENLDIEEVLF